MRASRLQPILMIIVSALAHTSNARAQQNDDSTRTRSNGHVRVGWFASLDASVGRLSGTTATISGLELGAALGAHLRLGVAGYGLVNQDVPIQLAGSIAPDTLRFGYGGFRAAYRFRPTSRIQPMVELLVGGGEATPRSNGRDSQGDDDVVIIVPSVVVEANFTRMFRGIVGIQYRYAGSVDLPGASSGTLSGVELRFGVRAGRF